MTRIEELALVARCVACDDRRAFARLVDATREPLLRFLTGLCGSETVAADLAQEAYIKAWRGLQGWIGTGRFSTWLYAIAVNEFRTWLRTRRPETDSIPEECGDTVGPMDARMDLATAIRTLPAQQRAVVLLFYYRDMPIRQIARVTDMPENTVKSHLSRARIKLRELIER